MGSKMCHSRVPSPEYIKKQYLIHKTNHSEQLEQWNGTNRIDCWIYLIKLYVHLDINQHYPYSLSVNINVVCILLLLLPCTLLNMYCCIVFKSCIQFLNSMILTGMQLTCLVQNIMLKHNKQQTISSYYLRAASKC